jgi:hypothetical protein
MKNTQSIIKLAHAVDFLIENYMKDCGFDNEGTFEQYMIGTIYVLHKKCNEAKVREGLNKLNIDNFIVDITYDNGDYILHTIDDIEIKIKVENNIINIVSYNR